MTTANAHERAKKMLDQALDLSPDARTAFLAEVCADDAALRAEVESLLDAVDGAETYFDDVFDIDLAQASPTEREGMTFGHYKVARLIARGGMGAVYLAQRDDDQYRQEVALKVLKSDALAAGMQESFAQERQILARLEHPNIARILDAGRSDEGASYLVMEYVRGTRIDDYCSGQNLDIAGRLALFEPICDAMSAAHGQLIVHCDLKPQNILVTTAGLVKVLDFGISRIMDGKQRYAPSRTPQARLALTPNFAAPEQWCNGSASIATDIYSLGILLYKVLTGLTPYDRKALHAWQEAGLNPPEAPSMRERLKAFGAEQIPLVAHRRGTTVRRLLRALDSDLQDIVAKAIAVNPTDRYSSSDALWSDLRNYLSHRPVSARPGTPHYRARKWVRRERGKIAVTAVILGLVTGVAVQNRFAAQYEKEQARTIAAARDNAEAVARILAGIFGESAADRDNAGTVTVRAALALSVPTIMEDLPNQPEVQQRLAFIIGGIYTELGLFSEAEPLLALADAYWMAQSDERSLTPTERRQVADIDVAMTKVMTGTGRYKDALARAQTAGASVKDAYGPLNSKALELLNARTEIFQAQQSVDQAIAAAEAAVSYAKSSRRLDSVQRAVAFNNLALAYRDRRDIQTIIDLLSEALAIQTAAMPDTHPLTMRIKANLASAHLEMGELEAAERLQQQVVEAAAKQGTRPNRIMAQVAYVVGAAKLSRGEFTDARPLLVNALSIQLQYKDAADYESLIIALALATCDELLGNHRQAQSSYEQLTALAQDQFAENILTAKLASRLAGLSVVLGDGESAATYAQTARGLFAAIDAQSPGDDAYLDSVAAVLDASLSRREKRSILFAALERSTQHGGPNSIQARNITQWLAELES